ncbi:MAG: hypothetical protein IJO32_05910 [Bacilli bacterium]|nr:hypothetical protein [Bacilli bacterium]
MMNVPTNYAEWINCFEFLKTSTRNNEYIEILKKGTIEMDENLLYKFIDNLDALVAHRLTVSIDKFIKLLESGVNDNNVFIMNLLDVRKEFNYLYKLCDLNVLPQENRDMFRKTIQEQADLMQKALEEKTLNADRTGLLRSQVRNNPVNRLEG